MAEPLNLEFLFDDKVICNVTYRWGASAGYAQELMEKFAQVISAKQQQSPIPTEPIERQKYFVELLIENEVSGLSEDSHEYLSNLFPTESFKRGDNHSDGLIGITPKDIEHTQDYSFSTAQISLYSTGETKFSNHLLYNLGSDVDGLLEQSDVETVKEFEEEVMELGEIENYSEFKNIDFMDMSVNDVVQVLTELEWLEPYFKIEDVYYAID